MPNLEISVKSAKSSAELETGASEDVVELAQSDERLESVLCTSI